MSQECCNVVGGRVQFKADGQIYHVKADVEIEPTQFTREADAAGDGSLCVTVKPRPARAKIKFIEKCDGDVVDLYLKCSVDVTIVEIDTGDRHFFTKSIAVGDISKNIGTGEVDGIEIVTDIYSRQRG